MKKSSAGLTKLYIPQDLVGKLILAVTNLPPRQVANFISMLVLDPRSPSPLTPRVKGGGSDAIGKPINVTVLQIIC